MCVCVCVCVCARARACVRACVCVIFLCLFLSYIARSISFSSFSLFLGGRWVGVLFLRFLYLTPVQVYIILVYIKKTPLLGYVKGPTSSISTTTTTTTTTTPTVPMSSSSLPYPSQGQTGPRSAFLAYFKRDIYIYI